MTKEKILGKINSGIINFNSFKKKDLIEIKNLLDEIFNTEARNSL